MAERVFITGAGGFIGRALAERYRARGTEVLGVDLVADPANDVVAGDIGEAGPWQLHAAGCDLVVHTAAAVTMRHDDRAGVHRANVVGTRNALEAAERAGARFLHLSTVVVFGTDFPDGVDERFPPATTGLPYGDTKVAAESLVQQAMLERRAEVVIVRPADVYGPGSRAWATIPTEMLRRRQLLLPAMGRGVFSPVFVDDLVEGIVLAGDAADAAGQILTLSGGTGVATKDFFAMHARVAGRRLPLSPTGPAMALARARQAFPGDPDVSVHAVRYLCRGGTYSIEKARRLIGFEPRVELADGLARTEAWLRRDA